MLPVSAGVQVSHYFQGCADMCGLWVSDQRVDHMGPFGPLKHEIAFTPCISDQISPNHPVNGKLVVTDGLMKPRGSNVLGQYALPVFALEFRYTDKI